MDKERIVIYYGAGESAGCKSEAAVLRKEGHSVRVLDAGAYMGPETDDIHRVIFRNVSDPVMNRIRGDYGDILYDEDEPQAEDDSVDIPDNWRDLKWNQLQRLASKIAPDGVTVRSKEDAFKIIEDAIEANKAD